MLHQGNADVHALYEESVQSPDEEVAFIRKTFRRHYGREPMRLREDFCGSCALATQWVKSHPRRQAVGVDLDVNVLAWAEENHRRALPAHAQRRLDLHRGDVRTPLGTRFD